VVLPITQVIKAVFGCSTYGRRHGSGLQRNVQTFCGYGMKGFWASGSEEV
jgi:hypothetical protein